MKGDFSRSSFDPRKHYRGVRMQQGRLQLDADWNEQVDILLHLIATQLHDLLGRGATAATAPGFAITLEEPADEPADQDQAGQPEEPSAPARTLPDFQIGAGRYYVDGILCENEAPVLFSRQPDYPAAASMLQEPVEHDRFLVYLDVWGRHITAAQDPAIREVALGGPDTTTRVKTVWQVKLLPLSDGVADDQGWRDRGGLRSLAAWEAFVAQAADRGRLRARWQATDEDQETRLYRLENHLYRVEIHTAAAGQVTFKWSRENGSVVFPITAVDLSPAQENGEGTLRVTVEDLERDPYQLQEGSWVELVDDVTLLNGRPLPLCQVTELDRPNALVTLRAEQDELAQIRAEIGARELHHPLLRRWEADAKPITPAPDTTAFQGETWLDLENGIQVAFSDTGTYQVGDYWLIPARTHLDDGIEWHRKDGQPLAQAPHGIAHHYAPLALLQLQEGGWSVIAEESAAFGNLPRITATLSATDGQLQQVQETVDTLVRQTHVFETVTSQEPLEPGDLVSLDPTALERTGTAAPGPEPPVKLASSKERDGQLVLGVVTEPIAGQTDRYRIALYGRVHCKVVGVVGPGDLLVPSHVPGRAQKGDWYLRPGTILGKALGHTRFDAEGTRTGTVDVLVTLG